MRTFVVVVTFIILDHLKVAPPSGITEVAVAIASLIAVAQDYKELSR